LTVIVTFGISM